MKLSELAEICRKEMKKKINIEKLHTHDGLHEAVKNVITPLLASGFSVGIWAIELDNDYHREVIKYNAPFTKHKNCKWADRGNFEKFIFTLSIPDMEINDIRKYFERKERAEEIKNLTESIVKHEKELTELKNYLAKLTK